MFKERIFIDFIRKDLLKRYDYRSFYFVFINNFLAVFAFKTFNLFKYIISKDLSERVIIEILLPLK